MRTLHGRNIIAALLLLLLAPQVSSAASPWFCTTQGRRLAYVRHNAENGRVKWLYTMTFDKVSTGPDGGCTVEYTYDFRKPGGAQMYGGPIEMCAHISSAGDVTLDIAATLHAVFSNMFPKAKIASEGGMTALPAALEPGDSLPDASAVVTVLGMKYTVSVTERSVVRREPLRTPAGTFDCIVVSEHKIENGVGRNRDVRTLTWYAAGVGEVRHDTFDWKTGKLQTFETLESID